jgi:hypothetical protein
MQQPVEAVTLAEYPCAIAIERIHRFRTIS